MRLDVPRSPKQYTKVLTGFLGVDYTSIIPNARRSSHMVNLINNNGYLEDRPGYDVIGHEFGTRAEYTTEFTNEDSNLHFKSVRASDKSNDISIEIVKPERQNNELKIEVIDKDIKIILQVDNVGNILTTAKEISKLPNYLVDISLVGTGEETVDELPKTYLSGGESQRINGLWNIDKDGVNIFIVHVKDKLYELNSEFNNPVELETDDTLNDNISQGVYLNNNLIIFDGKRTLIYGKIGETWKIDYLNNIGKIPTTSIARQPDGTGGQLYEDVNLLTPYRENAFISNGVAVEYKVDGDADGKYDNEEPTAWAIDMNGDSVTLTVLNYDYENGTVTFDTPPPATPVPGRDNVFIRFKVTNEETKDYINNCTIITTFGYNGNNNRIFATGNEKYPNVDWFCEVDDPTYFPANNYTRVGFEPIQNYLRLNDGTLAIQKKVSDTDATVYYRKSMIFGGVEVFPIASGVKSVGCISKYANVNLLNDPITLTELGVYSIVGSDYGEKFAMERGYFVKNKLLEEPDLENAMGITLGDKYYLSVNDKVYIADARYATSVRDSASDFQYEWYYWENVPVRIWFTYNNELYFATEDGDICKFDESHCYDYNVPTYKAYDTAFLDLGSITDAKTVKRVTVISRPYEDNEFTLSYITNDESSDITTRNNEKGEFPSTLQEKEKIKKIMFVKFRLSSDKAIKMNFYQIAIDYVLAGHYRGE